MPSRITVSGLKVAPELHDFIETEALPGTGIASAAFWDGFARIAGTFAPRNRALVARRDALQAQIDAWHTARQGQPHDPAAYKAFLLE